MRETEIAIVGAGLAGSLAATMLGRAGHAVTLIDPFDSCRPDFRCEKLEEAHVATLRDARVLDEVLPVARHYRDIWVARLGRLAEIKPIAEYGIDYSALVNRLRALVPDSVAFVQSKVAGVALSDERQTLTLTNGEKISARLVIGANGVMGEMIGRRREISRCHSVSVGFDVEAGTVAVRGAHLFRRGPGAPRRLSDAVSPPLRLSRKPVRLSRAERPVAQAPARQSGRDHRRQACRSSRGSPARCRSKGR